ncbi:peptidase S28 [Martensiomyces pterosporus]|nr:peptidase S28 [Martensiomyces pterosporus]
MRIVPSLPLLAMAALASGQSTNTTSPIPPSSTTFWFPQPVDHFGLNNSTWNQQYLYNATFYKPGGPIYVLTPAESRLSNYYTDRTHFASLAQRTNGLLVAVEHRFYGKSNPMPDLSGASLKYHTIPNVLEDYASFIRAAQNNPSQVFSVPVTPGAKVVFAGGSYGGNVAAWMRAKYPDLVSGSWASSAIVYGRLQNYQFDQSYGTYLTSLGCGWDFGQAVSDLDSILLSGNATAIAAVQTKFGCPPLTAKDFAGLLSVLGTAYAMAPVTTNYNYANTFVCSYFNGTRSHLDTYAAIISDTITAMGYTQDSLSAMANTSLNIDNYALGQSSRVWYYQECTWSGNWQVAPPPSTGLTGYRSQLVDLDYFQPNCQNKFGSSIQIPVDVGSYNNNWFKILRGVSNIYYTTGSVDIWRDSTVAPSTGNVFVNSSSSPIFVIEGATHVQDLSADQPNDLPSVRWARALGDSQVLKWIS